MDDKEKQGKQLSTKKRYRPQPYHIGNKNEPEPRPDQSKNPTDDKENDNQDIRDFQQSPKKPCRPSSPGWLSTRKNLCKTPPDFILDPRRDGYSEPRDPKSEKLIKERNYSRHFRSRYTCEDCAKWFTGDPRYSNDQIHLQRCGRHRVPRPKSPPGIWNIGFPEDYDPKDYVE